MSFFTFYWQAQWCERWRACITFEEMRAILVALEAVYQGAGEEMTFTVSDDFERMCEALLERQQQEFLKEENNEEYDVSREEDFACVA